MRGITDERATVVYDGWTPNAVQVHIHSGGSAEFLRTEFLHEIFWYPFVQCQKMLVYTVTPGDAEASLAVSKSLGFIETYRMKDGWGPGIDMVIKEMRREDCRWIQRTH
jgi:hypothetical protein